MARSCRLEERTINSPLLSEKPVALVTGASRGIGAAIARRLADEGYHLVLVARSERGLARIEEQIHEAGGSATIAPLDLREGDHIDALSHVIRERFGRLDLLVLNAAILGTLGPVGHQEPKEFESVLSLNLLAPQRLIRVFDPALRRSRGKLVALTSSVARTPRAYWGAYAASKAGLENLVETYAAETASLGIRTIIMDPGATRTEMRAKAFPGEDATTLKGAEAVAEGLVQNLEGSAGLYRFRVAEG